MEQNEKQLYNLPNQNLTNNLSHSKYEINSKNYLQCIPYQMYDHSNYKLKRIIECGHYLNKLQKRKSTKLIANKHSKFEGIVKGICTSENNLKNIFHVNNSSFHCDSKGDNENDHVQSHHKLYSKNFEVKIKELDDKRCNKNDRLFNQAISNNEIEKSRTITSILNGLDCFKKDEHELHDIQQCEQKCNENTSLKIKNIKRNQRIDHKNENEEMASTLKKLNTLDKQQREGT